MQTASAALIQEQAQPDQRYYRVVELERRYWNGSAYVWDSAADISGYVVKVSSAKWKLDRRGFSEWKSPSFQVEVDNSRNLWSDIEPRGLWLSGAHAPYIAELSKVKVRFGQYLADGSQEDLYVFSGLVNRPPEAKEDINQLTLYCVGMDELLRRTDAQLLSTLVEDEEVGTDSGTEFETSNPGSTDWKLVVKKGSTAGGAGAATELTPDTDYQLDQANDKDLGIKVTLSVALSAGQSLWVTYRYWYQDRNLEWIVTQLLILAGISSYTVEPAVFSNAVSNTWTQTIKADWDAGTTLTNIETAINSGSFRRRYYLVDDFSDNDYSGWTHGGNGSITAASGYLELNGSDGPPANYSHAFRPWSRNYGTWRFRWRLPDFTLNDNQSAVFLFLDSNATRSTENHIPEGKGYGLYYSAQSNSMALVRWNTGVAATLISFSLTEDAYYDFRVTRTSAGAWEVMVDGVSKGTATDNTYTTASYFCVSDLTTEAVNATQFDDFYWADAINTSASPTDAGAVLESAIQDTGGVPTAWGKLSSSYSLNGASIAIYTYTSSSATFAAGNDPAGWVAISGTGQILSALLRYIKVRVVITSTLDNRAEFDEFALVYYTSTTTIPLVNLTNMTALDAIRECAKFVAYELGFTAAEVFFWRQRSTATEPVLAITKDTNLKKEISFNNGTDRIYNSITSTFGAFKETVDPDSQGEASPTSIEKYGFFPFPISSTLVPKEGANVARAVGQTIYEYTSVPRKQAQVEMKVLVQFELGDLARYHREHKFGRWRWGDRDRAFGREDDPDFVWHADPDGNGWNIDMRIEGIEFLTNPKEPKLRYDLVEA